MEWFTAMHVPFEYKILEIVESVSPSFGTIQGGTTVSIHGYNFIDSELLRCKFGTKVVTATYLSPERITCISPESTFIGDVNVEIANNAQDFTMNNVTSLIIHIQ